MQWKDITVDQFSKIKKLDLKDMGDQIVAGEILLGINGDDMSWFDFCKELKKLDFLSDPIPEVIILPEYKINGRMYKTVPDLTKLSVGRYMDFTNLAPKGELEKVLAVFLVPEGEEYGDNLEQVYADIRTMNIVDAYAIFNFFRVQLKVCIKTIKDYSVKKLKKNKELQKAISDIMDYYSTFDL